MSPGATLHNPILINSIGHSAGLLVFGLILVLLIRDGRTHGIRQTRLSLAAALLAFAWNAGSLVAIGSGNQSPLLIGIVMTASFSVLSFLPAVLLHVALRGRQSKLVTRRVKTGLVTAGYLVSTAAVLLHASELLFPAFGAHQAALATIVFGFGLLLVVSFFSVRRREPVTRPPGNPGGLPEWISLTCLLLFTTSFLHFGDEHVQSPWAAEVTWHHIGIPVVLIVLLQDYRFLLLDTFSRFLMNFGLAALYISGLLVLNERFHLWELTQRNNYMAGLCLVGLCVSLILYAHVRNVLEAWMSRVIFHRRTTDDCGKIISGLSAAARSENELLERAAHEVARHVRTERFAIVDELPGTKRLETPSFLFREAGPAESRPHGFSAEAQIPLRFSSGDSRYLMLGARRGGRRYFSEDLEDMRRLAAIMVEQVERFRADELKRLVAQAELRALQAQVNPHFLFNALNTLYGTIDRGSFEARRMVLNLADIFRYCLQGDRAVIQLSEEVRIIQAYLEIESLRLGDRLSSELLISPSAGATMIPILSIQPLVENAVKHGIAEKNGGGRVSLRAEKTTDGLRITVKDTGVGFQRSSQKAGSSTGVGLENVRRRLLLCHGPQAELHIHSDSNGSTVTFFLPDPVYPEWAANHTVEQREATRGAH